MCTTIVKIAIKNIYLLWANESEKFITNHQTEIAYRCNFDKSNYNAIESGKRNTTILTLLKIANALDVSIKEFLED
jgi:transcriptional regulator with XRE-family HTH domain